MTAEQISLVCFPHAGGSDATFNSWRAYLSHNIRRVVPAYFGRSLAFEKFSDFETLASYLAENLAHLNGRVVFYGHSMGALLAYDVACKLSKRYGVNINHLFVSGRRAPQIPSRIAPIHHLSDEDFLQKLCDYGGIPKNINSRLLGGLISRIRSHLQVAETYQYHPGITLPCPITAIHAHDDYLAQRFEMDAWRERTSSDFSIYTLDGDHFFHCASPGEIVNIIQLSTTKCFTEA